MTLDRDEWLMSQVAVGRQDVLEVLVRRYATPLLTFIRRLVIDHHRSEELFQEVFVAVWQKRGQYHTQRAFRPWLYAIAMNVGRAAVRKEARKLEQPGDLDAYAESSAPHMRDVIRDQTVQRALKQLSHDQREVIVLHWFEGLDFQEIANIVDASLSAVKVRAHRGYERLRALLGGIQ